MKFKFISFSIIATLVIGLSALIITGCNNDMNDVVMYRGQVVYINTTTPFPNLTVKITDGQNTHCQTQTDAGGLFSLKVRVNEIDGSYYLLAGDSTCIPKKVSLGGYGQAEVDLGVIEVEGPALPTVKTTPLTEVTADAASLGGEVLTDGRLAVTARGICYGLDQQPSVDGMHTTDGNGLGAFSSTLKNLEHNTIYYARAYATNKMGTSYGEQVKFTTELGVPIVITDSVYRITAHSARCKGHVESDGGYKVTQRGTCWSQYPDPTLDDDFTNDGSGIGEFISALSNLQENTKYYVRTYATNSTTTTYGEQIIITTLDGLAVVTTDSVNNITATGFTVYGNVLTDCDIPVTARGFCCSTSQYPTVEDEHIIVGKGLGVFQGNIRNLSVGTTYYIRAYATNATETTYGEQIAVVTLNGLPVVETNQQNSATATTITTGGKVTDNGGFAVTERGVCYSSTNTEPSTTDEKIINGKGNGAYSITITGLAAATKYYIRAYATNENGTAYGETASITTKDGSAIVALDEISNITAMTASTSITVTDAGSATLQSCGICWSTNPNPTIADNKTVAGGKQLNTTYACNMSELKPNTTYYVRGYATTDVTTAYSEQKIFRTNDGLPIVTTTTTTATSTNIASGGSISNDGGYPITARGVCYSISNSTPTIADDYTTAGIGIGSFSTIVTNVSLNTTYYVRAYATNSIGTSYGNIEIVTTGNGLPTVNTTEPTLTDRMVTSGGQIIDDGGFPITARGVCYGTLPNPDLTSNYVHTNDGSGTGYYASTFSIIPGSGRYYIRAYATNVNGTTYGKTFAVLHPYDNLPTFTYDGKTYRVAPGPHTLNDEYITWSAANNYCENLTAYGYSDWRMPTLEELQTMYLSRTNIGGWLGSYTSTSNTPCYPVYWSSEASSASCGAHLTIKWTDGTSFWACDLDTDGKWWREITPHYYYIAHVRPIRVEE